MPFQRIQIYSIMLKNARGVNFFHLCVWRNITKKSKNGRLHSTDQQNLFKETSLKPDFQMKKKIYGKTTGSSDVPILFLVRLGDLEHTHRYNAFTVWICLYCNSDIILRHWLMRSCTNLREDDQFIDGQKIMYVQFLISTLTNWSQVIFTFQCMRLFSLV